MRGEPNAVALDAALVAREGALERVTQRWSVLAYGAVLAFVALLYSNPQYWWPWIERLRLAFVAMGVAGAATFAHRFTSGDRLRLGGPPATLLFAYLAFIPLSLLWSLDPPATQRAVVDAAKLGIVYVVVLNALHGQKRLRTFLLVGGLASLGPALGGIWTWWRGEGLVEGYRAIWRGMFADPNRLAMSLIAVMPFALYGLFTVKKPWHRALFALAVGANLTAVVLTHSRSGAVAAALAVMLFLFRGRGASLGRGLLFAGAMVIALAIFAPSSFWQRQATISDYEEDVSVEGRENAWKVLGVIVDERPLTGVGAGAFLHSWGRYAPLEAGGRRYVAHNVFMEIVGDLGLVAFSLFSLFVAWLIWRTWRAGRDPLVGWEARAISAGLAGYMVCEMVNGYSLSWFLYFLFGTAAATIRLADMGAALAREGT
jgi:putative inorganic carbon (HCO3(-)) transporter